MLNIKKNISINATPEKVWYFLLSLEHSMQMNRSHSKINFHPEDNNLFQIHQNFAIVKYVFDAKIDLKKPFQELSLSKTISDNLKFSHSISYYIQSNNSEVELRYHLNGTFGSTILEMSLKPILHRIIIDELRNIKSAVESSDEIAENHQNIKKLKPI